MELDDAILLECSAIETVEKLQKQINMSDANIMVLKKIMMSTSLAMGNYKKIEKEHTRWNKEISLLKNEYTTLQENHKKLLIDHWKLDREYQDTTKSFVSLKEKYDSLLDKSSGQDFLINQMQNHVVDIETKIEGGKIELKLMKTKHKDELLKLKTENQKSSSRLSKDITANEKKISQLYDYILIFGEKAASGVGLSLSENRMYKNIRLQAKLFKSKLNLAVNEESTFEELDVDETQGPLSCASSIDTGLGSSVYTSDDEKYPSNATTPTRDSCASPLESSFILNLPTLSSSLKINASEQHKKIYIDNSTSPRKLQTRSVALSPIQFREIVIEKKDASTATSPVKEVRRDSPNQPESLDDIEDSLVRDILSKAKRQYKIISPIPFNEKVDTNYAHSTKAEPASINKIPKTKRSHFKPKLNVKKKGIHNFFSYFSNMTRKLIQKECSKILNSSVTQTTENKCDVDSVAETKPNSDKHVIILNNNNNESNQLTVPNKSGLFIINTAPGAVYHMSSPQPIGKFCNNNNVTLESNQHNRHASVSPSNNLELNDCHVQIETNLPHDKKSIHKLSLISASKISIPASTSSRNKSYSPLRKFKESSKSHHLFDDVGEVLEHPSEKVTLKHFPSPEIEDYPETMDANKRSEYERAKRNKFSSSDSSQNLTEKTVNELIDKDSCQGDNKTLKCKINTSSSASKNEQIVDCCESKKINIIEMQKFNNFATEMCGTRKSNRKRKKSDLLISSLECKQRMAKNLPCETSNQSAVSLNIENDSLNNSCAVSKIRQKNCITDCRIIVAPIINESNYYSSHENQDVNSDTEVEYSKYIIKSDKKRVSIRNSVCECDRTEVKNGKDEKLSAKNEFSQRATRRMKPIIQLKTQNLCDSPSAKSPCWTDRKECQSNTSSYTDFVQEPTPALKRFKSNMNERLAESYPVNTPLDIQLKTDQNKKNIEKAKLVIANLNLTTSKPERSFIRKKVPKRIKNITDTASETLATDDDITEDPECIVSEVSDLGTGDKISSEMTAAVEALAKDQHANNIWETPQQCLTKLAPDKDRPDCQIFKLMILNHINDKKKKKKFSKYVVPDKIVNTLEDYLSTFTIESLDEFINSISTEKEKHIGCAIVEFLCSENRAKDTLLNCWPMLPMTQPQQSLLCFMKILNASPPPHFKENLFELVMKGIEYRAFHLNKSPHLVALKNLSGFYAVLCRITKQKDRLKLFCMDALYCLSFKAAPLVYRVLQSWPNLLPHANSQAAQDPLVIVMVHYLLSNFSDKCEYNSQQLKCLLFKKYGYETGKMTDDEILKMLLEQIKDNKWVPYKENITAAFLLLGKRCGVDWCHKKIIANSLMPIIRDHSEKPRTRAMAVQLIGPLVRPFPDKMLLQCEVIAKKLSNMLNTRDDPLVEDAIVSSLTYFTKKNFNEMIGRILRWQPTHPLSEHTSSLLELIVLERTPSFWKAFLSRNSKRVDVEE